MFLKEVSSAHQGCIYLIKNKKIKTVILWMLIQFKTVVFYFNIMYLFLWSKLNFTHHYSSLQCHMILQKSFWYDDLMLKKHFSLLSMLKTVIYIFISGFFAEYRKFKRTAFIWNRKLFVTLNCSKVKDIKMNKCCSF